MTNAAPKAIAVNKAVNDVIRSDRGRLMAGLVSRLGDFQLAEDALQDAAISALKHWGRSGIPDNPTAWLMKASFNKGIDRIRKSNREGQKAKDLSLIIDDSDTMHAPEEIPDERLRLIFTCCHPALEEKSRIALTLRTVCNLNTREISDAFLDTETTMGQRLSRSKAKIKSKGIGFVVPEPAQWGERLNTVLSTLYLIFTTGYVSGDASSRNLCLEGMFLMRLLDQLQPEDAEVEGALALMLLTQSRNKARVSTSGATVPISEQDHALWDAELLQEGRALLARAVQRRSPGAFQIKAAIADCHMETPEPDWAQMLLLYQSLWRFESTPVVALNWAVVLSETGQADLALQKLNELKDELGEFQPWHAASASVLRKLNRLEKASHAYAEAIDRAPTEADRLFLQNKLKHLYN
jgi:RNA polymerase sigma factor (sigma-70 family)